MATHKVPQDVETDDKLIGFLSLKQFIFVVLGLGFGYITFVFFTKVHPIAAIIWLPPMIVCLVLGLYQRKDQPVEVYLASAIRFYFKPRKRKWDQEGFEERVKITAPPKIEHHYTKSFTGEEAVGRLTNLSRMMDSRGWASKATSEWQNPQLATAAGTSDRLVTVGDVASVQAFDPQHFVKPVDIMDEQSSLVAQEFEARIQETDSSTRKQAIQALQTARQDPIETVPPASPNAAIDEPLPTPNFQKYPTAMHQKIIAPEEHMPAAADTEETVPEAEEIELTPQVAEPLPEQSAQPQAHTTEDGAVEISLH